MEENKSEKDWLVTLLLCIFAGTIGIHRFYAGKIGTGILQLITLGGCGIWTIVDLVMIITGKFTDGQGKTIESK
ncbi:MAG: TM2 domain-containing protein [Clostridia bacterium]|nr:TM2 domain-containing protein [Clostridia bacterium]